MYINWDFDKLGILTSQYIYIYILDGNSRDLHTAKFGPIDIPSPFHPRSIPVPLSRWPPIPMPSPCHPRAIPVTFS